MSNNGRKKGRGGFAAFILLAIALIMSYGLYYASFNHAPWGINLNVARALLLIVGSFTTLVGLHLLGEWRRAPGETSDTG